MSAVSGIRGTGAPAHLTVGKRRALQTLSTGRHIFAIMAADHVGALSATVRPESPHSVTPNDLIAIKVELVGGLADLASGVLIDPVLGLDTVIQGDVLPGDTGMMLGLEDGDYASMGHDPRLYPGWDVARAARSGANAIKCSFFYDPFAEFSGVHTFVSDLVLACAAHGLPLFAEPLTPPGLEAGKRATVVETARRIGALDVDVLKLEFPLENSADEAEWLDACAEVTDASPRPWTILSGGEEFDTYSRQLEVACAGGASGYVAGRTIWGDLVAGGVPFSKGALREARRRFQLLSDIAQSEGTPWSDWFESDNALTDNHVLSAEEGTE
jgi:tagatose 1,6-diphosphate aldolase